MQDIEEIRAYYAKILPYYEREVAARADLLFWRGLARRWRPGRILEIGCGTGSVAGALSASARTVGIDVSFRLLRRAGRRVPSPRASFVAADFREALFGGLFDLIIAPSDPLSHLTAIADRRRTLRAVARQLSPRGRFVLDALVRGGSKPLRFERRLRDRDGELRIRQLWQPAAKAFLWRATFAYSARRADGIAAGTEASFLARAWDPAQVRPFFSSCGLAVEELWGSYSRRPFGPGSRRLIVVARRAR